MNEKNLLWQIEFLSRKNWLQAVRILQKEIKKNPKNITLHDTLGDIYFRHKVFTKAVKSYQKALQIEPENERILFKLGNSFLSLNEYQGVYRYVFSDL